MRTDVQRETRRCRKLVGNCCPPGEGSLALSVTESRATSDPKFGDRYWKTGQARLHTQRSSVLTEEYFFSRLEEAMDQSGENVPTRTQLEGPAAPVPRCRWAVHTLSQRITHTSRQQVP